MFVLWFYGDAKNVDNGYQCYCGYIGMLDVSKFFPSFENPAKDAIRRFEDLVSIQNGATKIVFENQTMLLELVQEHL